VGHRFANEQSWAKGLGVQSPDDALLTNEGLNAQSAAYCHAIRDYHAQGKMWPLRYLIRHTAFHTLDGVAAAGGIMPGKWRTRI